MASTRKSRSVNKRFFKANEESPDKDGGNGSKSKQQKRKLADRIGSQWSKEELERFYEAYRKYGKDWKKKRKLADRIGSQWSKEELERFYEAYRKYGKDWKKVASVVRNRSIEMVEALYTLNRVCFVIA
ncbi:Always early-like protein [Thalictrum thalictroides]|uniref:Always early-like protein n=1 Tax=Thalictrum thalictroides TaxID=46969 RepID=A0A7J6VXV7_THATH|nr:Always early-like protein [Thalictrum thalictroides]